MEERTQPLGDGDARAADQAVTAETALFPVDGESPEMGTFRENLLQVSSMTTIGVRTLSCMSPRNLALEQVAGQVGYLPTAEEQVAVINLIFAESDRLFPDQSAHVVAKVTQDLLTPDRVVLDERALSRVGRRIVQTGLAIAPDLLSETMVNDSYAQDLLKAHMQALAAHSAFGFTDSVRSSMEDVGLLEPMTAEKFHLWDDTPGCLSNWLRTEIIALLHRQIEPDDYALLLDHAVTLPSDLRGRVLAHIANTFTNSLQLDANEQMVVEISHLINALPRQIRMTPLEAFHNQLTKLPHDKARAFFPIVHQSIIQLPELEDLRANNTRGDLLTGIAQQGLALETINFLPNESLHQAHRRYLETTTDGS